jgi:hypothetical protein
VVFECEVVRKLDGELLGEQGTDLSTTGMLVASDAPCSVGETVHATFRVPGTEHWISAAARISRIVAGRRHNDSGRAIALDFELLSTEAERFLRGALEALAEVSPKRSPRVDYAGTASLVALDGGK